jgi:hypothetical protein
MRKSSKNQIRTHCNSPSRKSWLQPAQNSHQRRRRGVQYSKYYPQFSHPKLLDAQAERIVQNPYAHSQIVEQALRRISDTDYSLGNYPFCIPVPAVIKTAHRGIK